MQQPNNYTWYENKRMLVFFENNKPALVLSGKIAEQTNLQFAIKHLEEWLTNEPENQARHEIIKRKNNLKQRLNAIQTL